MISASSAPARDMNSTPMSTVISRARASCSFNATSGRSTRWVPISTEYVRSPTLSEHTDSMSSPRSPLALDLAQRVLMTAYDEAVLGLSEGGIPIGAALYLRDGTLISSGHNRRVQERDASVHAETDAFRKGGRRRDYPDTVMVTTLSPCWYCSGLVRQFNIGAVVIGEASNFHGGHDWLAGLGVEIVMPDDPACTELLGTFILEHPDLWNEDIGL